MNMFEKLSEQICDELEDSARYAKWALEIKEEDRAVADSLYNISNDEMRHASILHNDVEIMIDTHDVPSDMMALWDYMKKKNIDKMQEAKTLQLLYKG